MEARSLKFIATACGGELLSGAGQTPVQRVCTDSRQAQAGDLFFALRGEHFDGHNFLDDAARKGAVAVVVEGREKGEGGKEKTELPGRPALALRTSHLGCAVVGVADTRKALGRLAAEYRKDFGLPITAIGGSNGKTTTKDLVASVVKQKLATVWSEASFNNDIGVPLTLLKLEKTHQAAVLEVGTNHPGELAPLVKMIQPRYGVITSIGREHLEFFGDLAGVAREQAALGELLPAQGKLFVNGDDAWTAGIAGRTRAAVVRAGFSDANDWRVRELRADQHGVSFRVESPVADFAGEYRTHLLGRHQVLNALFAVAVGVELGLGREEIQRGLAECKAAKMRLQLWELNGGVRVLDDTYNANADSMVAALQTLQDLPCQGRRVAVLGEMAELGAHSEAAHEEVGRRAAELGVGQLFAVGKMAALMARGARGAGLNRVMEFADVETAATAVKSFLKSGDLLLLKASRVARLERITERLRAGEAPKALVAGRGTEAVKC